jgi:hypothetical protein
MRRYFCWALLVAAGLLLGVASSSFQRSNAQTPPEAVADSANVNGDAVAELREIKAQLKEINTQLRTGVTKVFVVMNPDK